MPYRATSIHPLPHALSVRRQQPRALTSHPAEDRAPRWSPDGSRVFFASDRDGAFEIYSVGVDGSELVRITDNPGEDTYPALSPDGRRMVFQSERDGTRGLWLMDVMSEDGVTLTEAGGSVPRLLLEDESPELTPDWSPDGEWIAFTSRRRATADLWAIRVTGGDVMRLTDSPFRDAWPRFSRVDNELVFFSRRDTDGQRDELYVMQWPGGPIRRLTTNPDFHDFAPNWSPGGGYVVTGISDSVSYRALAIYDRDGALMARFAEGYHRVFQPEWSPDGSLIAYAARRADGEAADIYVVAPPR